MGRARDARVVVPDDLLAPVPQRVVVEVEVEVEVLHAGEQAVERGRIMGESSNIARDLCNEPSNVLTPSIFAQRAARST